MKHYFYRSLPYGSEAAFNPISLLVNGGFDELQVYEFSHSVSQIPWKIGSRNVWKNIFAPFSQINKYGWDRFLRYEVFPTTLNSRNAQYFPNYTLHLIGGGMASRKISEWYDAHGYPVPRILGALTTMSYHYINEIIEAGGGEFCSNVDPIADLLLFDPLGIILFNFDGVSEFFSENFSLNDWSMQPAMSFNPLTFRNLCQGFVMKYPITSSGKTSILYHFGIFGIVGLSFKTNNEESISFGAGVASKRVYTSDTRNGTITKSIVVCPMAGVYWDRNNSLLASLVVCDSFYELIRLNLFPGSFNVLSVTPGFFIGIGNGGKCTLGLNLSILPMGICVHHPK
ncbi:MAG: hypothetical protein JXA06_13650 [Bacteroidetes bacterium]|nr:hypothetical protein [Bacteroidota bacterium]